MWNSISNCTACKVSVRGDRESRHQITHILWANVYALSTARHIYCRSIGCCVAEEAVKEKDFLNQISDVDIVLD